MGMGGMKGRGIVDTMRDTKERRRKEEQRLKGQIERENLNNTIQDEMRREVYADKGGKR